MKLSNSEKKKSMKYPYRVMFVETSEKPQFRHVWLYLFAWILRKRVIRSNMEFDLTRESVEKLHKATSKWISEKA